jgi:Cu2+-exporting ATPase
MNTDTLNSSSEAHSNKPNRLANLLGQVGVSGLATLSLLIAAIFNPDLWLAFGVAVTLVSLTLLFISRVNKLVIKPEESWENPEFIALAENQKSRKELFASQAAKYWLVFVLLMAMLATVLSSNNEFDLSSGLSVFATVLFLSYSQTLSLTMPVAISRALKVSTDAGILIRNRSAFEKAARLKLVLFSKSGLLTDFPKGVNAIRLASNSTIKDEHKLLALAASVESMSSHAFAIAIGKSANKSKLKIAQPKNFMAFPGLGVQAVVGGSQVLIGSTALLIQRNIRMEVQELIYADESTKSGYSVVCVVVEGHLEGIFRFTDVVKPSSAQAIYTVARERIRVGIITGDSAGTAQHKANELNVSEVYAELSPERKVAYISSERNSGLAVGVIADPTTDLDLLAEANLSIALIGKSKELNDTIDVLVKGDDLVLAAQVIALSAKLRRRINLGLGFGLGYGFLSVVLFVAIVSPLQVETSPAIAALLGSLSVLFVTLNAYSLGKLK